MSASSQKRRRRLRREALAQRARAALFLVLVGRTGTIYAHPETAAALARAVVGTELRDVRVVPNAFIERGRLIAWEMPKLPLLEPLPTAFTWRAEPEPTKLAWYGRFSP